MRYLITARHGQDDGTNLTVGGRQRVAKLAEEIRALIGDARTLVLSSTTDRARQSSEILGAVLCAEFELHEVLWSQASHPEDFEKTLELVRNKKDRAEILVLVTHYEYVAGFPAYFARKELETTLRSRLIEKGQAWVIDCENKSISRLASKV